MGVFCAYNIFVFERRTVSHNVLYILFREQGTFSIRIYSREEREERERGGSMRERNCVFSISLPSHMGNRIMMLIFLLFFSRVPFVPFPFSSTENARTSIKNEYAGGNGRLWEMRNCIYLNYSALDKSLSPLENLDSPLLFFSLFPFPALGRWRNRTANSLTAKESLFFGVYRRLLEVFFRWEEERKGGKCIRFLEKILSFF